MDIYFHPYLHPQPKFIPQVLCNNPYESMASFVQGTYPGTSSNLERRIATAYGWPHFCATISGERSWLEILGERSDLRFNDPEFPNKSQLGEPVGASWSYYIRVSQPHDVQLTSGAKVERLNELWQGDSLNRFLYPKNAIESWGKWGSTVKFIGIS